LTHPHSKTGFSRNLMSLDSPREIERIATALREIIFSRFKKRGAVVAVSGGIDSSLVAALCATALGPAQVLGLLLPEKDSSEDTLRLSREVVKTLDIPEVYQDITGVLEAVGCYSTRDAAITSVIPEYQPGWPCKIVLPSLLEDDRYRVFSVGRTDPCR